MHPVFEPGKGKGIGHDIKSFSKRFDAICEEHRTSRGTLAFAFIFYDFDDSALRKILRDSGVFAKLDRLSGSDLSIFYLHSGSQESIEKFNQEFQRVLGVSTEADLPCVVFFKIEEHRIHNIRIARLDGTNLIHGFQELYLAIEEYIADSSNVPPTDSTAIRWLKNLPSFVGLEVFRAALKRGIDLIF